MGNVFRRAARFSGAALATAALAAALGGNASAATPPAGTVSAMSTSVGFTGHVNATNFLPECPSQATDPGNLVCEHFTLTVASAGTVRTCVSFPAGITGLNDVDVFVYTPAGDQIASGTTTDDPECVSFMTTGGTFEIRINPSFVEDEVLGFDISGTVTLVPSGGGGGQGGGGVDPPVYVGDARVVEPDAGTTNMTFTVSMGWSTSVPVEVDYVTTGPQPDVQIDYPATPVLDYVTTAGAVVFAPGETSKTITVPVTGDTLKEPNEQFLVQLALPQPALLVARIGRGHGYGTIVDNDTRRRVSGSGTLAALLLGGGGAFSLSAADNDTGKVRYLDGSGVRFRSTSVTSTTFVDLTRSATISGSGANGSAPVTFVLQVADNGPGTLDSFVLTLSDGTRASGLLAKGDIRYSS